MTRKPIAFDTTLSSFGNNTGIEVPESVMDELNVGKRPSLVVIVNGYRYQTTPGTMNGKTMLSFSAAHRKASGIAAGDDIHVEVSVATQAKKVNLLPEFEEALMASGTMAFFESLSNSLQRYHCDLVNGAKQEATRQRRIEKAVGLFQQGKKR